MSIDLPAGSEMLRRGDLIHTNVGNRRERTWFVLRVHGLRPRLGRPRCSVWMERWWDVDAGIRQALFRSAERAGGQRVLNVSRYPPKKKRSTARIWE